MVAGVPKTYILTLCSMKTALLFALIALWTGLAALTIIAMVTGQNLMPAIFFTKCLIDQAQKRREAMK